MADAKEIVAAGYDKVGVRYAGLEANGSEWPRLRRLEYVWFRARKRP